MEYKQPTPGAPPPYTPSNVPPAYTSQPTEAGYHQGPPPPPGLHPGYQAGYPKMPTTGPGGQPTVVTVVNVGQWGAFPMMVVCPHCSARGMTETSASPGLLTWLLSGALLVFGCWLGCCLIPCCIPECQDVEHRCSNCKATLGAFRRI